MRGSKGFPGTRKFDGKTFTWHSQYVGARAKKRAQGQRDRWRRLGYRVRVVEYRGSYSLYRRKK